MASRLSLVALLALLAAIIVCFAGVNVRATEVDLDALDEAPVPEGFSLPNIFNPVLDRADGRDQAKTLVNLVAKEPKVAYGVGNGPEKAIEDMWNGEADPESSASVAQQKMLKEVESLTKLIEQGKKILKVLPRKEKRLALLKSKLSTILNAKEKRIASEKLDEQQALLDAIKKRETAMATRLNALKKSQSKLTKSVGQLKRVIAGKKPAAKGKNAKKNAKKLNAKKAKNAKNAKNAKKHAGKQHAGKAKQHGGKAKDAAKNAKKPVDAAAQAAPAQPPKSFLEMENESEADIDSDLEGEAESESAADAESEADAEADAETESDFELQFEAAEAYDSQE